MSMQDNGRNALKTKAFLVNLGKNLLSEAGSAALGKACATYDRKPCGIGCLKPASTAKHDDRLLHVKAR